MGNNHSDASGPDSPLSPLPTQAQRRAFEVSTALVDLPPNVYVNRVDPGPPSCCLSPEQFLNLQAMLPLHLTYRKWQLLYGTEEHGFSLGTLRSQLERNTKNTSRSKTSAVLVVPDAGRLHESTPGD